MPPVPDKGSGNCSSQGATGCIQGNELGYGLPHLFDRPERTAVDGLLLLGPQESLRYLARFGLSDKCKRGAKARSGKWWMLV